MTCESDNTKLIRLVIKMDDVFISFKFKLLSLSYKRNKEKSLYFARKSLRETVGHSISKRLREGYQDALIDAIKTLGFSAVIVHPLQELV